MNLKSNDGVRIRVDAFDAIACRYHFRPEDFQLLCASAVACPVGTWLGCLFMPALCEILVATDYVEEFDAICQDAGIAVHHGEPHAIITA